MTTITFIGAGSTVFTKNIAGDILRRPALRDAKLRIMDIDGKRLEENGDLAPAALPTVVGPGLVGQSQAQRLRRTA